MTEDKDTGVQKYIPVGQAAEYLGVSRQTLKRWEAKGMLIPHRTPTNRRMYTVEQLDEALAKHQQI